MWLSRMYVNIIISRLTAKICLSSRGIQLWIFLTPRCPGLYFPTLPRVRNSGKRTSAGATWLAFHTQKKTKEYGGRNLIGEPELCTIEKALWNCHRILLRIQKKMVHLDNLLSDCWCSSGGVEHVGSNNRFCRGRVWLERWDDRLAWKLGTDRLYCIILVFLVADGRQRYARIFMGKKHWALMVHNIN